MTTAHESGSHASAAILLIEDDEATRRSISAFLRGHGHDVRDVGDATAAIAAWSAGRPDLIVLDLGLPDRDGSSVIRHVRREANTPILVLSARDREADKVAALDHGADDYMTKPFGMAELRARIDALIRRSAGPVADLDGGIRIRDLSIDLGRHLVTVGREPVHLTPREYEVLKVLISHAGRLVTHGRLLRAVWGTEYSDEAHYIHVYVSQIRRKLASVDPDGSLDGLIVAEPGVGYRVAAS
jgi:two-component system KDP operon response regulator KdpE